MRILPCLLVSLAACGGASKSSPVGNFAGTGGPAGPPPTIAWSGGVPMDGGEFRATGLPAVADDGSRVIYDWVRGDGGRGFPNLRLVVADRADQVLDTRVVLDADEVETKADAVDVAAHNGFLAESNAAMKWRPLVAAEVVEAEPPDDEMFSTTQSARHGDLTVRFDDAAHLVIEQGGKVVVDAVQRAWLVLDRPMYEGAEADEVCSNPIYLGSVHVDPARRIALIGTEYRGTDSCWEPTGEYHVVAW